MPLRLVLLGLALICVFAAIYGSFVPLDLRSVTIDQAVRRFADMPFVPLSRASKSDLITNVLLFVPIGFFGLGASSGRSRSSAGALLVPMVCATTVLSVGIEFGQIFVHGRTPSWNDVVAQIAGSSIGVVLWLVAGGWLIDATTTLIDGKAGSDRAFPLLTGVAGIWLVAGLLPFDFTVRLEELARKLRAGGVVLIPFSDRASLHTAGISMLLAIPTGAFFVAAARRVGSRRPLGVGLALGLATAVGLETAQLFSFSRRADVTDVIVNAIGLSIGVWLMARWSGTSPAHAQASARVRLWPILALICWVVLLAGRHWSPYDFTTDAAFIKRRIPDMFRVPFHSYYVGFAPYVLMDATTKLLMAVPVGAMLQLVWQPRTRLWQWVAGTGIVALSGGVFLALELGQLLLPSRVPDQTDVYIGTLGALMGALLVCVVNRRRAA